jgi:glycerophosphoryl diester phosphodiesterase
LEVIGHRGGAALGPENTVATILAAIEAGADGVEVDVRSSADGELVLMHDEDVVRPGAPMRVDEISVAELMKLGVARLSDAMAAVPAERLLVLEVKGHPWEAGYDPDEPVARAVAAAVASSGARRAIVSSFNPVALQVVRAEAPGVATAVLTSSAFDPASNLAAAVEGGHEECHVPANLLTETFVRDAHEAGKRVVAWTVDDENRIRTFAGWGVDGVICDDPREALAVLRRSG